MKDLSKEEITNFVGSSKFKEIGEFVNGYRINVNDEYVMLRHICMYLQAHENVASNQKAECAAARKTIKDYIEKYSLWPSNLNRLKSEMRLSSEKHVLDFICDAYQASLKDRA